jgi:transposase
VQPDKDSERRIQLKNAMKADPDAIVDAFLDFERRIEELEARLKMNSRNSSKPPGSDGYSKPAPKSQRKKSGRASGGQKGHKGKTLQRIDDPDKIEPIRLGSCPHSGIELNESHIVDVMRRQVFDLPETKLEVTEYQAHVYEVPGTGVRVHGKFPKEANAPAQYGFRFQAWLVYLVDYQFIPLRRVRQMCEDLFGYAVSEGTISEARKRCAANLAEFIRVTGIKLKDESILHTDETGMRVEGKTVWLHSISTKELTLYHIDPKRGLVAIEAMGILPSFKGRLIHDFWGAYLGLDCEHGICNAHIVRELTYFEDLDQSWARDLKTLLLAACKEPAAKTLTQWKRNYRRLVKKGYQSNPFDPPVRKTGQLGRAAKPKVVNLLDRLDQYEDWILAFLADPNVPFTNNQAEQDVRMAKVRQKISGCFRSWDGSRIFAVIRSYISTCIKQDVPLFDALVCTMKNEAKLFA